MNPSAITVRDIAQVVEWKDIKRAIKYFYPRDKNNYESVFERMKTVPKKKQRHPGETIDLSACRMFSWLRDEADLKDPFIKKHYGTIEKLHRDSRYSIDTKRGDENWSLSFRPWAEIFNIPISVETLDRYKFEDILAHLIWEITFYGTEKKMKKMSKSIDRSMKDVIKDLKKKKKKI